MRDNITTVEIEKFKDSVFFKLAFAQPSFKKKVKDQGKLLEYQTLLAAERKAKEEAGETVISRAAVELNGGGALPKNCKAAKATNTTKTLLQSPALEALRDHFSATKTAICGKPEYGGLANPSGIFEGLFECHKDLAGRINDKVAEAKRRLTETWVDEEMNNQPGFVTAFLQDYPAAIERARSAPLLDGGLGPLFDSADYPEESKVRDAFDIVKRWLSFTVPEGLPPELRQQAFDEMRADLLNAADTIKNTLVEGALKLCEHAKEVLQTQPGEKPKVIKDSLIGNILQFCETFQLRNTQADGELAAVLEQCKQVLVGVDPEKLRKYPAAREEVGAKFAEISATLDSMIETRKGRKLHLED